MYWYYSSSAHIQGAVLLNGFRSDEHASFAGYLNGRPSRASRDRVELAAANTEVRDWFNSQEARMRELDLLTATMQHQLAYLVYQANHALPGDYTSAFVSSGLLELADLVTWASAHDEIIVVQGWPLNINNRPLGIVYMPTGRNVELPENWIYPMPSFLYLPFNVFDLYHDQEYAFARHHRKNTWQKVWWRTSSRIEGLVLRQICEAWECEIGELLEPVEKRGWDDLADIGDEQIGQVPVFRLNRPTRRP
jgi:hypothetical protein